MASFFNLPPETRNNIYGLLLADSSSLLNGLSACRLLHEEAASYFYRNTDLTIELANPMSFSASTLSPIPDRYLRFSRVLTANLKFGYVSPCGIQMQAQRLTTLADRCPRLETLVLNFISNASKIMSGTIDECVLHASHPLFFALQRVLSCGIQSVRVNLNGVWFAPGLVDRLVSEGNLEVVTCESSTERAMHGQEVRDHMWDLCSNLNNFEDAAYDQPSKYDGEFSPMPSVLESALMSLDFFSPTEDLDEDAEDLQRFTAGKKSEASEDEPMFDGNDMERGSEEELTDDDDVDEEDMEDIDDIEAIVENLQETTHHRLNEKDVCYMTNFAPDMLRAWSEGLALGL